MTERDLVAGCIQGKASCQQALFERFAGKMLVVCQRYGRHQMEAEDILQEAFIKVFEHLDQFGFKGSLEGWIRRIVVNTALKIFDRKSFAQEQIGIDPSWDSTDPEPLGDMQLHAEDLMRMIRSLPDGYRAVFNLYAIEGYNHQEIAEMLGTQESTSRSQLVKARKFLQMQLMELYKVDV